LVTGFPRFTRRASTSANSSRKSSISAIIADTREIMWETERLLDPSAPLADRGLPLMLAFALFASRFRRVGMASVANGLDSNFIAIQVK